MEERHVLVLGSGQVAVALLELFGVAGFQPRSCTVLSQDPFDPRVTERVPFVRDSVVFRRAVLDPESVPVLLGKMVSAGDVVVDLTYQVDTLTLVRWCHGHGVFYLNTAVEEWESDAGAQGGNTLQARHLAVEEWLAAALPQPAALRSAFVLTMGMNPGLVSLLAKRALRQIAAAGRAGPPPPPAACSAEYARMAADARLRTIHCSERDTQVLNPREARRAGEFVNTWSVQGFLSEGLMDVQMGWGTHEAGGQEACSLRQPQMILEGRGRAMDDRLRSVVPLPRSKSVAAEKEEEEGTEIVGMNIPHSENFTLCRYLTLPHKDENGGQALYRPSVYYVYQMCPEARASVEECGGEGGAALVPRQMNGFNIAAGHDAVGALLIREGDDDAPAAVWAGSILDIGEVRRMGFVASGPTAVQVAAGVWAGLQWVFAHRATGLIYPEDMDEDFVLGQASPFLGGVIVEPMAVRGLTKPDFQM